MPSPITVRRSRESAESDDRVVCSIADGNVTEVEQHSIPWIEINTGGGLSRSFSSSL